jgi:hypothetical protein
VRFRITALATASALTVLTAAGFGLVAAQGRVLNENFEESIRQGAANIEAAIGGGQVPQALGGFGDDDSSAQVVTSAGQVLAATPNIAGQPPIAPPPAGRAEVVRTPKSCLPTRAPSG